MVKTLSSRRSHLYVEGEQGTMQSAGSKRMDFERRTCFLKGGAWGEVGGERLEAVV